MELQKAVDETVEAPATPEKIRRFVHKNLRGLFSISIKQENGENRWKQINKIKVDNKPGEVTSDDPEEICEAIMRIMNSADDERDDGEPAFRFQLQAEQRDKNGHRARPSVEYTYSPEGSPDDYSLGGDEYDNPHAQIISAQGEYISKLQYHVDDCHHKILEISSANNQALKPLMDALGMMGHFYAAGLQNQQVALAMMYDVKKVAIEEQGHTARVDKWMNFLSKPVAVMSGQFLQWATSKLGVKVPPPDASEDDEDDDEDDDEKPTGDVEAANAELEAHLTDEQKENPVATYASALASFLEPDQWFAITEALSKRERRVLRDVMQAKTDKACVAAYEKLTTLSPAKLITLNSILNDEQRKFLEQLGELVKAAKDRWDEDE